MKRKNLGRAVLVLFLLLPALAVWWPLWFMGTGALMPLDELRAALGPVLQGAEGSAFWPLLPSWPTKWLRCWRWRVAPAPTWSTSRTSWSEC